MTTQQTPASPVGNPNDPWNLSGNGYDPDKFYTRATDGNGHDTVMHVKISPALFGEIQHIIQSRMIPQYRTNSDVVRDSLIHRMRHLADNYTGVVSLHDLEIEQRQAELDMLMTQRESWNKLINDLDNALSQLIGANELDEADWLIEQNEYNESMSPPYLVKLAKMLGKHRSEIRSARKSNEAAYLSR